MTLKSLRKQLEGDLGLEPDALKPHKHLLSDLIDKVTQARSQTARRSTCPLPHRRCLLHFCACSS